MKKEIKTGDTFSFQGRQYTCIKADEVSIYFYDHKGDLRNVLRKDCRLVSEKIQ